MNEPLSEETLIEWETHKGAFGAGAAEIRTLRARVALLESVLGDAAEALEPFALVAEHDIGQDEADYDWFRPMSHGNNRAPILKVGDLRRAASVSNQIAKMKEPD